MKPLFSKPEVPFHRNQTIPLYFRKMFGTYRGIFPRIPSIRVLLWSLIASFSGISLVAALSYNVEPFVSKHLPTIIGSFGASAVLIYGAVDSPLAQPRNFLGGHIISAFVGVSIGKIWLSLFNQPEDFIWLQAALAVSISIVLMQITRTVHPPGGATALIAVSSGPNILNLGYLYMAIPVLFGTILMLGVALIINNIQRQYPMYWRYPRKPDIIMEGDNGSTCGKDSHLPHSVNRGEMYEPRHSDAKEHISYDDDLSKPELKEAKNDNTLSPDIVVHVEKELQNENLEANSQIQYSELAETYRKKYEEAQVYLKKLEKELEALRLSQAQ
ncbi:hypothetical protein K7432_011370 [Basidiobolus ranarum]|uniref:HPP transmembrane region domain-containing protein n=1 Tax=Basidiobolus ranarum TaxID=34480 RepID=A0ABR2WMG7_9FUNG